MATTKRGTASQPFSIRLGPAANLLVTEEVRRTGRSRSAIVNELTEEAAKTRLFPGIEFGDEPRRARLIGTGLDVWELIMILGWYGDDDAKVREDYPRVNQHHIQIARAYHQRFPEEIDAILAEQHRPLDELVELYPFLQVYRYEE